MPKKSKVKPVVITEDMERKINDYTKNKHIIKEKVFEESKPKPKPKKKKKKY
tara:strand:- start:1761 stop:1916 length:156 start_codon:yes stop_codon:yes gene_type:complete